MNKKERSLFSLSVLLLSQNNPPPLPGLCSLPKSGLCNSSPATFKCLCFNTPKPNNQVINGTLENWTAYYSMEVIQPFQVGWTRDTLNSWQTPAFEDWSFSHLN